MRFARRVLLAGLLAALPSCRGEAPRAPGDPGLTQLVDSLIPAVEQATGLKFRTRPRAALITRDQAHAYLAKQLAKQLGGGRGTSLEQVYKLFGLLPDSIDLQHLYLDVLTEQVAGYYDPDSSAFFGVAGTSPTVLRLTVEHELVHALQHDYVPLDSILDARDDADRLLAAQSVLEGQATFAMMRMQPGVGDQVLDPDFWETAESGSKSQLASMPELQGAPRLMQDAITFPYFQGAEYIRWWTVNHSAGEMPYGARMPRSSEEILAPTRAFNGDRPDAVTFVGGPVSKYSDVLGAAEMRVLLATARGQKALVDGGLLGWGGDRYALYDADGNPALVWIAVFDSPPARDAMLRALAHRPPARMGYRTAVEALDVSGHPGLRLVVAPTGWTKWSDLPRATLGRE